MKKICALLLISCVGVTTVLAQTTSRTVFAYHSANDVSPLYTKYSSPVADIKRPKTGLHQKQIGRIMVIIGATIQISGIITLASYRPKYDNPNSLHPHDENEDESYLGFAMTAIGTGIAVPGTVMWVKGARKYSRYKREQSLNFNFGTTSSLVYRF